MRPLLMIAAMSFLTLALSGQAPGPDVREALEDLQAGRYGPAEQELSRILEAQPANWSLWCELGKAQLELGRKEDAIDAFERARRLAPKEAPPYFGLAFTYMRMSERGKALESYEQGLDRNPKDVAANQNYALLLMQQGNYSQAIVPLKRLKGLQPADMRIRATLIEADLKTGMKKEAREEVDGVLDAHLAGMREQLSLAGLLAANRERTAAVEVLQRATSAWPNAAGPHGELGIVLMESERYEGAVQELGRAAQIDPDSERYALGLGEALLRWRHDPVALQYLLAVREKFGKSPFYVFQLGLAYFYLTQFPAARDVFENLSREQPESSRVQYLLGGTYQAMGTLDKAEESFRKAIALKPDDASYYVSLATLLKKAKPGDLTEAVQLTEKALALNPDNEDAKLLMASCDQARGKLAEAQALLEAVVAHSPDLRAAHVALAQVYFREKRMEEAQSQESIASKLAEREQNSVSPWGPGGLVRP
jgi:tetratricopeptide (TPR) repeat protein